MEIVELLELVLFCCVTYSVIIRILQSRKNQEIIRNFCRKVEKQISKIILPGGSVKLLLVEMKFLNWSTFRNHISPNIKLSAF